MIKDVKICGISDLETLNYIVEHTHPPQFIGFITNYKKSKRYIEFEKLKELVNIDRKGINFVSVLVNPDDEILEKTKNLKFDELVFMKEISFHFNLPRKGVGERRYCSGW